MANWHLGNKIDGYLFINIHLFTFIGVFYSLHKFITCADGDKHDEADIRRASSRGIIPRAKIKTVKMTFVIVFGKFVLNEMHEYLGSNEIIVHLPNYQLCSCRPSITLKIKIGQYEPV